MGRRCIGSVAICFPSSISIANYWRKSSGTKAGKRQGAINIVVLQADERQFGLVVDAIHDTEEIVVKPLQKQVKDTSVFAGATIMGDGKVALILDVLGLAQRVNVVAAVRERALSDKLVSPLEASADRRSLLLFATRDGSQMAVPLSSVDRLEEVPRAGSGKGRSAGSHAVP